MLDCLDTQRSKESLFVLTADRISSLTRAPLTDIPTINADKKQQEDLILIRHTDSTYLKLITANSTNCKLQLDLKFT